MVVADPFTQAAPGVGTTDQKTVAVDKVQNPKIADNDHKEDFDDIDESEIDYEGEDKAHDRVN